MILLEDSGDAGTYEDEHESVIIMNHKKMEMVLQDAGNAVP